MIDEIRLKLMKQKPTMHDLVQAKPSKNAEVALRVAMRRASKEQNALLKKAAKL